MNSFRAALKFFNKDAFSSNSRSYKLSENNISENPPNKVRIPDAFLTHHLKKSREYGVLMKEIIATPLAAAGRQMDIRLYSKQGYPWNTICKDDDAHEENEDEDKKMDDKCDSKKLVRKACTVLKGSKQKTAATQTSECQSKAPAKSSCAMKEASFKPHRFVPKDDDGRKSDGLCEKRKKMFDELNQGISTTSRESASQCNATSHSTKIFKVKKPRSVKCRCRGSKPSNPCGHPDSVEKSRTIAKKMFGDENKCPKENEDDSCGARSRSKKQGKNPCGMPKLAPGVLIKRKSVKCRNQVKRKPKRKVCGREPLPKPKKIPNRALVGKVCAAKKKKKQKMKKKLAYPWGLTKTAQQVMKQKLKKKKSKKAKKASKKRAAKKTPFKSCRTSNVQCKYKRCKKNRKKNRVIISIYKKFKSCKGSKDKSMCRKENYPWSSTECVKILKHRSRKRAMPPPKPSIKTLKMFAKLNQKSSRRRQQCSRQPEITDAKQYHSVTYGPRRKFPLESLNLLIVKKSSCNRNEDKVYFCNPADCNYLFCISGIECKVYPSTCKKLDCEDKDARRDILCKLCNIFNTRGAESVTKYFGKCYHNKEYYLYTDASFYDVHEFMSRMRVSRDSLHRIR